MFNLEAEQSILGTILLTNNMEILDDINLRAEDFKQETHRIIYAAMQNISTTNKPIDIITLIEELRKENVLEAIGGISYITSLTTIVPAVSNVKHYGNIVQALARKRKLNLKINSLLLNLENFNDAEVSQQIEEMKNIVENTQMYNTMFSNFSQIKQVNNVESLPIGFKKLDKETHGLEYGTLTVLTGEPATGKSTMLNQIIANSISQDEKVFLYSGELPQRKLKEWFTRTVAKEEHLQFLTDEYGKQKTCVSNQFLCRINKWADEKLFIFNDDERPSEANLVGTIMYLAKQKQVRLIVLDNLMTMIVDDLTEEYKKQKYLVNNLKNLAKKFNLVIILVAHVTKESKKNVVPNMFEVAGASEVVNLADYVFKLTKDDSEDINRLYILKNRIGGTQGVYLKLYFDEIRKRFYTQDGDELDRHFGY